MFKLGILSFFTAVLILRRNRIVMLSLSLVSEMNPIPPLSLGPSHEIDFERAPSVSPSVALSSTILSFFDFLHGGVARRGRGVDNIFSVVWACHRVSRHKGRIWQS